VVSLARPAQKETVSRISFSLKPSLQKEFDRVSSLMGYNERSKAIQLAIQNLIGDYALKADPETTATGTILILYAHHARGVDSKLTDIGHTHRLVIASSLHIHQDEENCFDVIVVKGKVKQIMELEKDLRKLEGVRQLRYSYLVAN
jgi:CopG family transcriptional regulator, nickel-responsive regulator